PASSTATAVTDCLCTSSPITIMVLASKPLGATGERTDLNRGLRPRSYQVTLDGLGRRRRHNAGKSDPQVDIRNRVSRRRPSLCQTADAATAARMTVSSGMTPERVLVGQGRERENNRDQQRHSGECRRRE